MMTRQRERLKERQEVAIADPLASMTPEDRFAQVIGVTAKARALLLTPTVRKKDDEYEKVGVRYAGEWGKK